MFVAGILLGIVGSCIVFGLLLRVLRNGLVEVLSEAIARILGL